MLPHVSTNKKANNFARNEQKKTKRDRHVKEKELMGALQGLGSAVGEYYGDGQGECYGMAEAMDSVAQAVVCDDSGLVEDLLLEQNEDSSDDAQPLLFLYDCETTGLSIYNDHIIEIAAEVVDCPVPHSNTTFTSLVKTSRRIPLPGIETNTRLIRKIMFTSLVINITNITPTMIRGERPLSVVFPEFLDWLITATSDISRATGSSYHPGVHTRWFQVFINLCPHNYSSCVSQRVFLRLSCSVG